MKEITYQAYNYVNDSTFPMTKTVNVKNFAGVKIIVSGSNTDYQSNTVKINNNIFLQPYCSTLLGNANYPYQIEFNNNSGEFDVTQMSIYIPLYTSVTLIFKFYTSKS